MLQINSYWQMADIKPLQTVYGDCGISGKNLLRYHPRIKAAAG
jgi:hypothetical protein